MVGAGIFLATVLVGTITKADHSWGTYHWARTSNPLVLKLGDNLSSYWDPYLATASSDWSASAVLDTSIVPGSAPRPKTCRAKAGRVEVCNATYGNNGWLGVAQVWVAGNHITQGTVKLNDSYFKTAKYNTPAWKNLVLCQEIGHTFGLDHQDENFSNTPLGSCMDYSSDPTPNQHPNAHDYEQLELIYAHIDGVNTSFQSALNLPAESGDESEEWGRKVREQTRTRPALYERDLGRGQKVFTFVYWAGEGEEHTHSH